MATLVLTVVGGAVGGPIGAGLGATLGRTVDGSLFRPKGRQGPRLTELAVQTSSYATQIPRLFGTMRVAGSVIWATDLIESRSSDRAGKGQPSVTSYSYSANFAVLLSGRPIRGVGRIWADGKLLRGVAGDWKTQTGFRLHLGGEDQVPDPLIAAAEGVGTVPAHRGCAYAVFEGLQLADFGNRIPSLTFEVSADGPVSAGAVIAELSGGAIAEGEGALPLIGYSAQGDSVRGAVEGLLLPAGYWLGSDGVRADRGAAVRIEDAGARADAGTIGRGARAIAASDTAPAELSIGYYDAARDYQTGVQRAVRASTTGCAQRIELPAVVEAGLARGLAARAIEAIDLARETRRVSVDWGSLAIAPGDRVTIGEDPAQWRVSGWTLEGMALALELKRIAAAPIALRTASGGRATLAPDALHGPTRLAAFELPPLQEAATSVPRVAILAAGEHPGWRRAALLASEDDGESWDTIGSTAAPASLGTVTQAPGWAPATTEDRRSAIELLFANDAVTLSSASRTALDLGANLAMVGDELLQFGEAVQLAPCRWRLRQLWRGRRGTEAAIGTQRSGDRFALIQADAIRWIEPRRIGEGVRLRVRAVGIDDGVDGVGAEVPVTGWSLFPPAPVHLRAIPQPDGALRIAWVRRSRLGWRWRDGAEVLLGEESELYRVRRVAADGTGTTVSCVTPQLMLPAGADRPARIEVRQVGSYGDSLPAVLFLS